MTKPLFYILAVGLALAGCNRMNPGTWLNGGADSPRPEDAPPAAAVVVDTRPLIAQVQSVSIAPTPTGAIVRASGIAAAPGWYGSSLVATPVQDGTLTLEFRSTPPESTKSTVIQPIIAATAIKRDVLQGVRHIVVRGATNSVTATP
ncbi:hypothetical protein [Falsirhodobacter sp. alg1]|uniref:hypothetical protein n=1 Tax=Falsirhodobacter sp. alg1 TaxID=1472418 RepID=UPI000788982C|nr:hypothetical protein [Falsirhodobacter sp. alg1]